MSVVGRFCDSAKPCSDGSRWVLHLHEHNYWPSIPCPLAPCRATRVCVVILSHKMLWFYPKKLPAIALAKGNPH